MEKENKKYLYPFGRLERASLEVDRLFHTDEPVHKLLDRLERLDGYIDRLIAMGNDDTVSLDADVALLKEVHTLILTRAQSLFPTEATLARIHPSLKELMTKRLGVWQRDVKGDYNV